MMMTFSATKGGRAIYFQYPEREKTDPQMMMKDILCSSEQAGGRRQEAGGRRPPPGCGRFVVQLVKEGGRAGLPALL